MFMMLACRQSNPQVLMFMMLGVRHAGSGNNVHRMSVKWLVQPPRT